LSLFRILMRFLKRFSKYKPTCKSKTILTLVCGALSLFQANQTESQSQTSDQQQQSEGTQAGEPLSTTTKSGGVSTKPSLKDHHVLTSTKSVDYSEIEMNRDPEFRSGHMHNNVSNNLQSRRNKSKSSEEMNR